ncbi:hypothetical protein [Aureivirga sp. CE67]|uniref:hypothetical protein n=1 Tax=Aureivirga sp. CE67 TaxID=1788983 RepID=UPI0018C99524|nr:hypothetical protein [Aureivirga sp. CE67]
MKKLFTLFYFLSLQFAFSQEEISENNIPQELIGKWEVIILEKGAKLSEETLEELDNEKVVPRGDHQRSLYIFGKDGKFRLISINDYGQTSEEGTFQYLGEKNVIKRNVKRANKWGPKKLKNFKIKKSKILYLKDRKLVLKTKRKVIYLKKA